MLCVRRPGRGGSCGQVRASCITCLSVVVVRTSDHSSPARRRQGRQTSDARFCVHALRVSFPCAGSCFGACCLASCLPGIADCLARGGIRNAYGIQGTHVVGCRVNQRATKTLHVASVLSCKTHACRQCHDGYHDWLLLPGVQHLPERTWPLKPHCCNANFTSTDTVFACYVCAAS